MRHNARVPDPRSILIVDAHAGFRRVLRQMLESDGWRVLGEVGDAEEAVRACAGLRPDVVLADARAVDADGLVLSRRLSETPGGPSVVLITGGDADLLAKRVADGGNRRFSARARLSSGGIASLLS